MQLSKKNQAIIEADQRGYHCDSEGRLYNPQGVAISGFIDGGYRAFSIRIDGHSQNILLHRFIAFQLRGDLAFTDGIVVRHLDNDKLNNRWENLELGSVRENYLDLPKQDRIKRARHAANCRHAA